MKILVIIIAYDDMEALKQCITSLLKTGFNLKIVIVDNFGDLPDYEKYEMIKPVRNLGFAGGVNFGIKSAGRHGGLPLQQYDWVWILNPDTEVKIKGILGEIKGIFGGMDKYDIFSPVIYDKKGEIWFAGGKINKWTGECTHKDKNKETAWVSGCSMFVRPKVFEKIGLFDEKFFLFYEDVDFCLRAKTAGFKIGILDEKDLGMRIVHNVSKSVNNLKSTEKYKIESESKLYFLKKHWREFYPSAFLISWARGTKHKIELRIKN